MAKFFVDAFADMFGDELEKNDLILAPSKIKKGKTIINFTGYDSKIIPDKSLISDIKAGKYQIIPLTQQEWIEYFTPYLDDGEDIVFFSISLELLTEGGADLKAAFAELDSRYPNQKVILVNTLTVSRGTSDIAKLTTTLFKRNNDFMEAVKFANNLSGQYLTAFVVDDVEYLAKNPLVDQVEEVFSGSLVNMKPIISINTQGKIDLLEKVKGFKTAVSKLYSIVTHNGENIADYTFSIVSLNADDEAQKLYNRFLEYVSETEISLSKLSINNAIVVGAKCVGLTFHSRQKTVND